ATASLVREEEQHGNTSRPTTRMQMIHPPLPGGPRPRPRFSPAAGAVQPRPPAASGAPGAPPSTPAVNTVRRYPLTLIHFQLHYGSGQPDVVALQVPASD